MNTQAFNGGLPEIATAWANFQHFVQLRPIRNEDDYARIRDLADALADVVGDDEEHQLYSLLALAMDLLERWEEAHVEIPNAPPREVLRYLLEVNDLKQKDLAEIASQTLISDILSGRRQISKRLAKSLAERFHIDIAAFIA